jgi:hypothetical protein
MTRRTPLQRRAQWWKAFVDRSWLSCHYRCPPGEVDALEKYGHKALATQLAIATGAPNAFAAWVEICRSADHFSIGQRIAAIEASEEERRNIEAALATFRRMSPDTADVMKQLAEQANRAGRFSFATPIKTGVPKAAAHPAAAASTSSAQAAGADLRSGTRFSAARAANIDRYFLKLEAVEVARPAALTRHPTTASTPSSMLACCPALSAARSNDEPVKALNEQETRGRLVLLGLRLFSSEQPPELGQGFMHRARYVALNASCLEADAALRERLGWPAYPAADRDTTPAVKGCPRSTSGR